jgi:hypothetical protein
MPDVPYHSSCSEIGLAELIEALDVLNPGTNETRTAIAGALGLGWSGVKESEASSLEPSFIPIPDPPKENREGYTPELKVPINPPNLNPPVDVSREILEPSDHEEPTFEIFEGSLLESADALEPTDIKLHMGRPMYQPLLSDIWFRGLMSLIMATSTASNEIDHAILERGLVKGELLEKLPFKLRPTLKQGVLLFLDRSESMQPFWRDEQELLVRLQRFLGRSRVHSWWLRADRWASGGPRLRWFTKVPSLLPQMTPLLIVSDFGLGGELTGCCALFESWMPLLDLARNSNCPIAALIPAPESYWPNILKKHIPHSLVWDRGTSISAARRHWHRIR